MLGFHQKLCAVSSVRHPDAVMINDKRPRPEPGALEQSIGEPYGFFDPVRVYRTTTESGLSASFSMPVPLS